MPNLLNRYPESEAEERYDVYACIEESVGYKVRGDEQSELLEVKTRLERKKRGAEQWQKELIPRQANSKGVYPTLANDVKALLKSDGREINSVSEVKLDKSRIIYRVYHSGTREPDEKYKGVSVECTLIKTTSGAKFTSICVEHSKHADKIYSVIEELKLSEFERERLIVCQEADQAQKSWLSVACMGYPGFVKFLSDHQNGARHGAMSHD
ncbi:hypothetical protein GUITHDRAFT_153086 [Guillardia theta CCMP2712]|uniref:Uncharacterized protein n=2 Tax=Guillardia theta TaxID=55529 RepID=L1J769_GUITC|nr:hypothetical protein GUITHDRAFT_153086 [Guillardia theta CCMP2712]EKX44187.1 hypothetical protein GUITHDRAFT_153086 [Guillardia theta CCMP2712]|eukprot:XP_005831167.1 hypothetical protein GUITHDRAFT_153086 [Guillardia theta CCMP2712]